MKNLKLIQSTSQIRLYICFLLSAVTLLALASCAKKDQDTVDTAIIRIINVAPTTGTFNIYVDDKMMNSAAIPFGGSIAYSQTLAGSHTLKFTTATDIQSLYTQSISLSKDAVYSYFLTGKLNALEGLLVDDKSSNIDQTKSAVRFINLSPDAPALNLNIVGGATLATGKAYKTNTDYATIDAKTYNFEIKDSNGAVKATLNDVVFSAGRFYTIVARGLVNPGTNEQSISIQSVLNQ